MSEKTGSWMPPPRLVRGPWLASEPTLILGRDTGIFVLKLQVTPCQRRRADSGAKQPRNPSPAQQHAFWSVCACACVCVVMSSHRCTSSLHPATPPNPDQTSPPPLSRRPPSFLSERHRLSAKKENGGAGLKINPCCPFRHFEIQFLSGADREVKDTASR